MTTGTSTSPTARRPRRGAHRPTRSSSPSTAEPRTAPSASRRVATARLRKARPAASAPAPMAQAAADLDALKDEEAAGRVLRLPGTGGESSGAHGFLPRRARVRGERVDLRGRGRSRGPTRRAGEAGEGGRRCPRAGPRSDGRPAGGRPPSAALPHCAARRARLSPGPAARPRAPAALARGGVPRYRPAVRGGEPALRSQRERPRLRLRAPLRRALRCAERTARARRPARPRQSGGRSTDSWCWCC